LLLIVRNGAFASLKCISGIKVDGTNGYNDNHKPESVLCGTGETCLRVEVDEVLLRSENKMDNVIVFKCMFNCEDDYENAKQTALQSKASTLVYKLNGFKTNDGLAGITAGCCKTNDCNLSKIEKPETPKPETPKPETPKPETSSGSKFAASLTLLIASVAGFFY